MALAFSIDCGEFLPGHRLIANGLRVDGRSDDDAHREFSHHVPGKPTAEMVSLTYRIEPALPASEIAGDHDLEATVRLSPEPDPQLSAGRFEVAAEIDATPGGVTGNSTAGAFGPFMLPDTTQTIVIELMPMRIDRRDAEPDRSTPRRVRGQIEVDLVHGVARWAAAA